MTEQEKAFISLRKYYLFLQHKLTKYEMVGINPPKFILKNFDDAKRRLQIFSKARQKS